VLWRNPGTGLWRLRPETIPENKPAFHAVWVAASDHIWLGSVNGLEFFDENKLNIIENSQTNSWDYMWADGSNLWLLAGNNYIWKYPLNAKGNFTSSVFPNPITRYLSSLAGLPGGPLLATAGENIFMYDSYNPGPWIQCNDSLPTKDNFLSIAISDLPSGAFLATTDRGSLYYSLACKPNKPILVWGNNINILRSISRNSTHYVGVGDNGSVLRGELDSNAKPITFLWRHLAKGQLNRVVMAADGTALMVGENSMIIRQQAQSK
jgi:hypothetical protein